MLPQVTLSIRRTGAVLKPAAALQLTGAALGSDATGISQFSVSHCPQQVRVLVTHKTVLYIQYYIMMHSDGVTVTLWVFQNIIVAIHCICRKKQRQYFTSFQSYNVLYEFSG